MKQLQTLPTTTVLNFPTFSVIVTRDLGAQLHAERPQVVQQGGKEEVSKVDQKMHQPPQLRLKYGTKKRKAKREVRFPSTTAELTLVIHTGRASLANARVKGWKPSSQNFLAHKISQLTTSHVD